jgi:phage-related protein
MLGLPHARAMPSVENGVYELRVRDGQGIYRVFYLLKSESGIFVFHAFTKKTQTTPRAEIELGRKRLLEMLKDEKKK